MTKPTRPKSVDCRWLDRLSCCKVRCRHPKGEGLTFISAHCRPGRCRYYLDWPPKPRRRRDSGAETQNLDEHAATADSSVPTAPTPGVEVV